MISIAYDAPPTISRFMDSDAFVRCLVGPVGGGKSSGCIMELLRRGMEQRPGPDKLRHTRWVIIRNTYRELKDTTRNTFEQWVRPELGKWREQDFTFQARFADVEADFLFRALDRPEDVNKLLSLEVTGAYINEAREVPKTILDVLKSRCGRYPAVKDGGCSWSGIIMDTNPMHVGHEYFELFKRKRPPGHEIFEQPSGLAPDAENVENLPPDYYVRICQGQDEDWVDEYVRAKYPLRDRASIYGDLLGVLEQAGFVGEDFAHPTDGIFVTYDLGISDATAQWYWRLNGVGGVDLVDHYEASGKGISHFFDEADKRSARHGFEYLKHWLPHDARARTLTTGASVVDSFFAKYGEDKVALTPELTFEDGLQAGRWLLEKPCRFHARAATGVKALKAYRYKWDADRLVFSRKPMHDWSSHTADSWRYIACAVKTAEWLTAKPEPKPPPRIRTIHEFTLDEAYELTGSSPRGARI